MNPDANNGVPTIQEDQTMPTYCEDRQDRSYANRYGHDYEAPDEDGLYECGEYHCEDCYPDGAADMGCDCEDCRPSAYGVWPVDILSYGHKPAPVFYSTNGFSRTRLTGRAGDREVFLGCEVEYELSGMVDEHRLHRAYRDFADFAERTYSKEDSSLHNGVEVVSHPMTLAAWQESGGLFYGALGSGGAASESTCGMHVHVNRSSFGSDSHQVRFGMLVLLNPDQFAAFAGRRNEHYASFQRFGGDYGSATLPTVVRSQGRAYGPRGAVNYGNSATIEVRMFASTSDPATLLGNLELVHALHGYTSDKNGATLPDHLTWSSFQAWLQNRTSRYPNAAPRAAAIA